MTEKEFKKKFMSLSPDKAGTACLTMGLFTLLATSGVPLAEVNAALEAKKGIWNVLHDLTMRAKELIEAKDKRNQSIVMRCRYILGTCRGEADMKAEATAILELLGEKP